MSANITNKNQIDSLHSLKCLDHFQAAIPISFGELWCSRVSPHYCSLVFHSEQENQITFINYNRVKRKSNFRPFPVVSHVWTLPTNQELYLDMAWMLPIEMHAILKCYHSFNIFAKDKSYGFNIQDFVALSNYLNTNKVSNEQNNVWQFF